MPHPPENLAAVWRILDANQNRAAEGLRVVEDYARLALDDPHLCGLCKQLRHDLQEVAGSWPQAWRMASRETRQDVGTTVETAAEMERLDLSATASASFSRVQQALRCLEEYGKLVDPESARQIQSIRYRSYTLQRALDRTRSGLQRLESVHLCVLIDGRESLERMAGLAAELVEAGVDLLQLRDKRLSDRELIACARRLRQVIQTPSDTARTTRLIINDRPDIAAIVSADGVHLGQSDMSVKDARAVLGPEALIGVSTHSIEQARQAVIDGADYLGCGPTFASQTKSFSELAGLALLGQVHAEIRSPAFAIGGIDLSNVAEVVDAGFRRIAVSAAVLDADDPKRVAQRLRAVLVA